MADLYKNKYRIPSARAQWWDYSADAAYYVTICTKDRTPHFGKVVDGVMQLSEIGGMVQQYWLEIPVHFPFVLLDEYVVMPNHLHGILVIDKGGTNGNDNNVVVVVETQDLASLSNIASPQNNDTNGKTTYKFGPQSKNLASIIRGFKILFTNLLICRFAPLAQLCKPCLMHYKKLFKLRLFADS